MKDSKSTDSAISPAGSARYTRRQTLITLSSLIGGSLFAKSAYAELVNNLLGKESRTLADKMVSPSSSLILTDGGNGTYTIRTNGIPDHPTGTFPNQFCPSAMRPSVHVFQIPKNPQTSSTVTIVGGSRLFGVALNGVVFDSSGPFWKNSVSSGWHYDPNSKTISTYFGLDINNAHVEESGMYHYHGRPEQLQKALAQLKLQRGDTSRMCLIGFAADGFPIYTQYAPADPLNINSSLTVMKSSYQLKQSSSRGPNAPAGAIDGSFEQDWTYVPGLGHLDECNGRLGITDEYPGGTYYYVLTDSFPFVPRLLRGSADHSFTLGRNGNSAPVPGAVRKIFG